MKQPSIGYGTLSVCFINATTTVFNSPTQLGTSTLYAIQANGGLLSNSGFYTLCFDDIKVITDSDKTSLQNKYLDAFYGIKIKESFARKPDIGWLSASAIAKEKYKKANFDLWKLANIELDKYYVDEFLPGTGTAKSFQIGIFENDYQKYIEESWASDLTQNDYIQSTKDDQETDKTRKMLRPSLSESSTPAIVKATDGSALSLDNSVGLIVLAMQDLKEKMRSATAEIEKLKKILNP